VGSAGWGPGERGERARAAGLADRDEGGGTGPGGSARGTELGGDRAHEGVLRIARRLPRRAAGTSARRHAAKRSSNSEDDHMVGDFLATR
jgi:hypothetical protein